MNSRRIALVCGVFSLSLTVYALTVLTQTLPNVYAVRHWSLTWVVFDLVLGTLALLTGIGVWRASPYTCLLAASCSTMLICDAWFDGLTASQADLPMSLLSMCVELPSAALFGCLAVATRDAN